MSFPSELSYSEKIKCLKEPLRTPEEVLYDKKLRMGFVPGSLTKTPGQRRASIVSADHSER